MDATTTTTRMSWGADAAAGRHGARPRAGALFGVAVGLAIGGTAWSVQAQSLSSGRPVPAGLVVTALRDASFALPFVLVSVVLAAVVTIWAAGRLDLGARTAGALRAVLTGTGTAIALAAAAPLRDAALGTHAAGGGSPLSHLAGDIVLLLPVTVLIALVAITLPAGLSSSPPVGADPVAQPAAGRTPARRHRYVARLAICAVGAAALGLVPAAPASASGGDPGQPCLPGAPQRSFDVTAIDLQTPLNRSGDNDRSGKMLVVNSVDGQANTYRLDAASGIGVPDPHGALTALQAVRQEETSQKVSVGLRDDPIQPLSVRVNEGDCVTITFTNQASGGRYGLHIDGLAFAAASSGDAIGKNADSAVAQGETTTFRYYVPDNKNLEGSHYVHPGPGFRAAVDHGLFGMLNVEPKGSSYADANTGAPLLSGWEAVVAPAGGASFREAIFQHHEVGNDNEVIYDRNGAELPQVDSTTGSYRPGQFALNYRSEPFRNRLLAFGKEKSHSYSSYTFGDPSTPMPRGYTGDPTKFRISHASGEKFHVYHLHGGGDRWRMNPVADPSWNYADTRLNKHPQNEVASNRLDAQSIGPGESYNLELEGGAGGVQHTVGDLLFHCHIAKHYVSGMWSFWRVYNTLQPNFAALSDRVAAPEAVTSDQLIGKNFGPKDASGNPLDASQTIKDTTGLAALVRQQLPPQGVRASTQDPSVYDWTWSTANPAVALAEPEDTTPTGTQTGAWPNQSDIPSHPGLQITDLKRQGSAQNPQFDLATAQPLFYETDATGRGRPAQLFNPADGRPAFPVLRTHLGSRPPFSPQGHSGSPLLGEHGDAKPGAQHSESTDPQSADSPGPIDSSFRADPNPAVTVQPTVDPYAYRPDGLCPSQTRTGAPTPTRHFNVVAIATPVQRSATITDREGKLFTLAQDKAKVYSDPTSQPLALRVNVGDCAKVTLTNEIPDASTFDGWSKTTMHIHHVQFDVQGSDGVSTGFAYEHSVRPYQIEDPTLAKATGRGATSLQLTSVTKFQDRTAAGAPAHPFIGVGMGGEGIEVRQVLTVDPASRTVTLDAPLRNAHPVTDRAGFEFIQYEWYADTQLDNIFWHDHVDGIHGWGHGLVGQLIVEPAGSKFYAPGNHSTEIKSGTIADIVANRSAPGYQDLLPGHVNGSFRELALWTINDNDKGDYSTINLKAAPFTERPSAANRYSSYAYGDPKTPLLRGYPGDPLVVRTINVSPTLDTLRFQGQRFDIDNRMTLAGDGSVQGDPGGGTPATIGSQLDSLHYGMSEKYTLALEGNGPKGRSRPGDYLYSNGIARRTAQGAWGIVRVLAANAGDLLPLPDNAAPGGTWVRPAASSSPPAPSAADNASPCPTGAPVKAYDVTALDLGHLAMFAPSSAVAGLQAGTVKPEPLVLHVAAGDCLVVTLTNSRSAPATFAVGKLDRSAGSSGVAVGYSPAATTAPGATRAYTSYADNAFLGSATVADLAGDDSHDSQKLGLYGAVVVSPQGATFGPGRTPTAVGAQVDVHLPAPVAGPTRQDYRDVSLLLADNDPQMSQDFMPYPTFAAQGATNINYQAAPAGDTSATFADPGGTVDPATPVVKTYAGDGLLVHESVAPGSEQGHVFTLGGLEAPRDMLIPGSEYDANQALGPGESFDAWVEGGAGGYTQQTGDYLYGDLRRPFTQVGAWGLIRVAPRPASCAGLPVGAPACLTGG